MVPVPIPIPQKKWNLAFDSSPILEKK